jgi:hypothetical protein
MNPIQTSGAKISGVENDEMRNLQPILYCSRHNIRFVVKNVPAQICPNCGEAYADETVTASLLREAEKMAKAGTKVDVREYALAGD